MRARKSETRARDAAIALLPLLGPLAWMVWNAHAHGDAFHFLARVSRYRQTHGAAGAPLGEKLLVYPRALVRGFAELGRCVIERLDHDAPRGLASFGVRRDRSHRAPPRFDRKRRPGLLDLGVCGGPEFGQHARGRNALRAVQPEVRDESIEAGTGIQVGVRLHLGEHAGAGMLCIEGHRVVEEQRKTARLQRFG